MHRVVRDGETSDPQGPPGSSRGYGLAAPPALTFQSFYVCPIEASWLEVIQMVPLERNQYRRHRVDTDMSGAMASTVIGVGSSPRIMKPGSASKSPSISDS